MRFEQLTLANFRGFRDECTIALGGDVIILRGPNGSGKTSMLDAIQWLLLGDVSRLRGGTVKKDEDYVANRYATGPPFVSAKLSGPDGPAVLSRRGVGDSMRLQVEFGEGEQQTGDHAQRWVDDALSGQAEGVNHQDLLRRCLLQQDDMREFLNSDPKERYEFIAELTGFERLDDLDSQLREELAVARKALREQRAKVETAEQEVNEVSSERDSSRKLVQRSPEIHSEASGMLARSRQALGLPASKMSMAEIRDELRARSKELDQRLAAFEEQGLRESRARQRMVDIPDGVEERRDVAREALQEIADEVQGLQAQLLTLEKRLAERREQADSVQQLAAAALEHLGEQCPICEQDYDPQATRRRLEVQLEDAPELVSLAKEVESRRREIAKARQRKTAQEQALSSVSLAVEELVQARALVAAATEAQRETATTLRALVDQSSDSAPDSEVNEQAMLLKERIDEAERELTRILDASQQTVQLDRRINRLVEEVDAREGRVMGLRTELAGLELKVKRAEKVSRRLGANITAAMSDAANASTALINELYVRLDIHPTFREFGFHAQRHYEAGHLRPWVYDRKRQRDGSALFVLSAGQLNALAICLFLALNLERTVPLSTAILDDPIQSMDDVNLLSLTDVFRTARKRRQLVVSTHDPLLAELFERKLRPLRHGESTVSVVLGRWGEGGPSVACEVREAPVEEPALELLAG